MKEKEKMQKFDELYAKMRKSSDVEDMKVFGRVMREAVGYLASTPRRRLRSCWTRI